MTAYEKPLERNGVSRGMNDSSLPGDQDHGCSRHHDDDRPEAAEGVLLAEHPAPQRQAEQRHEPLESPEVGHGWAMITPYDCEAYSDVEVRPIPRSHPLFRSVSLAADRCRALMADQTMAATPVMAATMPSSMTPKKNCELCWMACFMKTGVKL